jgi:hypothetical protein
MSTRWYSSSYWYSVGDDEGDALAGAAAVGDQRYSRAPLPPSSEGATTVILYAALGAPAWGALSALLHHRLAFIGEPGHMLGGGGALVGPAVEECRPRRLCSSWSTRACGMRAPL